jgi:hypothetical protein
MTVRDNFRVKGPHFMLGRLYATRRLVAAVPEPEFRSALCRHALGDWGDVDVEDKRANDQALVDGTRLLSAYHSQDDIRFWIITEADRSATTILLPEEY